MMKSFLVATANLLFVAGLVVGQTGPDPTASVPVRIQLAPAARSLPSQSSEEALPAPQPVPVSPPSSNGMTPPTPGLWTGPAVSQQRMALGLVASRDIPPGTGPWSGPGVAQEEYSFGAEVPDPLPGSFRLWTSAEFLYWWDKKQPIPANLVTSGSPADRLPGALGQPNSQVLFGPHHLGYDGFAGLRGATGFWLDPDQVFGVEAGAFFLENRANINTFRSLTATSPLLSLRRIDQPGGTEDAFVITAPAVRGSTVGLLSGGIVLRTDSRLWGTEGNLVHPLFWSRDFHLEALAGLRYLDLNENVSILTQKIASTTTPVTFLGTRNASPNFDLTGDSFQGSNHFLGGQLGLRGDWLFNRLFLRFAGTLALGQTDEVLDVLGRSKLQQKTNVLRTTSGGLYALPSNSGRFHNNDFSIVPELQFKTGVLLTPSIRAMVGYDFLYWTHLLRPGDQIDLHVNPRQVPTDPAFRAGVASSVPSPLAVHSDFWTQGLTFSLEFIY
jgi:hypothetical protein